MVELDDEFLDEVIVEVEKLWPGCRIIRGSPRYSPLNGDMERVNLTTQTKLNHWMSENNSKRWSVGCKVVQWQINTYVHKTIGNKLPYHLVFGQLPRVGISSLPLSQDLLDLLATEKDQNQLFKIPEGSSIEDAGFDWNSAIVPSNTVIDEEIQNNTSENSNGKATDDGTEMMENDTSENSNDNTTL